MINEQIPKHSTDTTDQPCLYFIKKRYAISGGFRYPDKAIWRIQGAGLPIYTSGQKESRASTCSGEICCLYSKTAPKSYQTDQSSSDINGTIYRKSSENGTGRVFIKTGPWRKKRGKLNYPALMTGSVSKNSHRFTVFLSLVLNATIA